MKSNVNTRFALQQEVDRFTDNLVKLAEDTMTKKMVQKFKGADQRSVATQLSNFLGVASATDSIEATKNWVRYQMGRKQTYYQWGNTGLGQKVLDNIEEMEKWAKRVGKQVAQSDDTEEKNNENTLKKEVHLLLIRRYAGYLRRAYVGNGGRE